MWVSILAPLEFLRVCVCACLCEWGSGELSGGSDFSVEAETEQGLARRKAGE